MLDWVLEAYRRKSSACSIHADIFPGQNKNRYLLGYIMWRVMTGQHRKIEYPMQIPRHTRCLVDSSFATIKIKYRGNDCETLDQLVSIVERSSKINTAVRYPQWSWRKWEPFLEEHFRAIPGIRQYQHFCFDSEKLGVCVKTDPDADEREFLILKNPTFRFLSSARRSAVESGGMSQQRREYLQRSVKSFV